MSTLRCPFCGLAHFATQVNCKQCRQPLNSAAQTPTEQGPRKARYRPSDIGEVKGQQSDASQVLDGVWREGSVLVMSSEAELPLRCVRCNARALELYERRLSWTPILINVLVVVSIFVFQSIILLAFSLLLVVFTRRTTKIKVGLCDDHHQKRIFGVIFGGGLISLGLGIGVYVAVTKDYWTVLWALGIMIVGAFVTILLKDTLIAKKIEDPYVWVRGMDSKFLDSLPTILE